MPDINSKEFTDELIYHEWEDYAEFAYQEFLRIGRGAIFIDLNEFRSLTGPDGEQIYEGEDFKYFSINNPDFGGQEIHDKILAYDPATQVVVVIRLKMKPVRKRGATEIAPTVIFMGNANGKPSPKELYESNHS